MTLYRLPPALMLLLFSLASLNYLSLASGDITLPKIFSDHMVLQRNSSNKIWGTAEPNQSLVIKLAGVKTEVTAAADGRWLATVVTSTAGGPHQLEIADASGEPKVIFSDVMIGEVWLCSGQSNMEWPMTEILDSENEIEAAKNYPNLRLLTVDHEASSKPLENVSKIQPWRICNSESVKDFSAVAYFYGRELSRHLDNVPIGLINSSWGGTPAEAWISRPAMDGVPSLSPLLKYWDENPTPGGPSCPANLFNGMIAPLANYKIRGTIWYQGEANNGRGEQYSILLPTLIADWRKNFHNDELPFYFVQLAPFRYSELPPEALAEIWDAQLKTLKTVPQTGMVVTTDIGNTTNIHPFNKQEVGRRLALIALTKNYCDELPAEKQIPIDSGPIFEHQSIEEDKIRIRFDNVGDGFKLRNSDLVPDGFQICGEDRKFVPATAVIKGTEIEVHSPTISNPVAVRFGWSDTAQPNLMNSGGLPASPFRTDDFPLESAGRSF